MSLNKYKPHLIFICEDAAWENIAKIVQFSYFPSFANQIDIPRINERNKSEGGWKKTLQRLKRYDSYNFESAYIIVLIDFDGNIPLRENGIAKELEQVKFDRKRIFVLGAKDEAEDVRKFRALQEKSVEAAAFFDSASELWHHDQLVHNQQALKVLCPIIQKIFREGV